VVLLIALKLFRHLGNFPNILEINIINIDPSSEVIYRNSLSNNIDTCLPNNLKDQITRDVPNKLLTAPPINNYNVDLNSLKKAVLQFSVQYYGKFNLSRKDATELQQNITKMITSSISKEINKMVIHNNTIDRETKNAFNSIIHFCNVPFEGLDTQYKFLNTLKTSDFYEKSKIITLDNTIQNVILHNVNTVGEKKKLRV